MKITRTGLKKLYDFRRPILASACVLALGAGLLYLQPAPAHAGTAITTYPQSSAPTGMTKAVDADGNMWFTKAAENKIARITPDGVTTEFTAPTANSAPRGITVGPDSNIWFVEKDANKIGKSTRAGVITEYAIPTANAGAEVIAPDTQGHLWFTESTANKVAMITTGGAITEHSVPTPNSKPFGLTAWGTDMWFTEVTGNKIAAITQAGAVTEHPIPTPNAQPSDIALDGAAELWLAEPGIDKVANAADGTVIADYNMPTPNSKPYGIISDGGAQGIWYTQSGSSKIGAGNTSAMGADYLITPATHPMQIGRNANNGCVWFAGVDADLIGKLCLNRPDDPTALGGATVTDGSWSGHKQPALTFTLADHDVVRTIKYHIQIATNSHFTTPVVDYTSALAAQGPQTFTVGQAAGTGTYTTGAATQQLADGQYYWRVQAVNDVPQTSDFAVAHNSATAFKIDTVPPTMPGDPTTTSPTANKRPTWTWMASTDATSGLATLPYSVDWSQDSTYATGVSSATATTNSYTHTADLAEGTWYFRVHATDAAGNVSANSNDGTVTIDNPPVISNVTAVVNGGTSVTIGWTTDKLTSSKVNFGPTTTYDGGTLVADLSPRVTAHSMTLTNLLPCATYNYEVVSVDAASSSTSSANRTFTTASCAGSAAVLAQWDALIPKASGGNVALTDGGATLRVTVPANATPADAMFQIKRLATLPAEAAIGAPANRTLAGNFVYDLQALTDSTTSVHALSQPVTVSKTYTSADITNIAESSLALYRWDGSSWTALTGCMVNTGIKTVTCTTTNFSTFALFGSATTPPTDVNPPVDNGGGDNGTPSTGGSSTNGGSSSSSETGTSGSNVGTGSGATSDKNVAAADKTGDDTTKDTTSDNNTTTDDEKSRLFNGDDTSTGDMTGDKGDESQQKEDGGNMLVNWWWLIVLAILGLIFFLVYRRRHAQDA